MSIFKAVNEKKTTGKVKKIFDNIKKERNIKTILKQVMEKGALDPLTKEMIYMAVSMTNSCEYCIRSHTAAARKKGMSDKMLKEIIAVVGMANETNRLVDSYQVEVDSFLK